MTKETATGKKDTYQVIDTKTGQAYSELSVEKKEAITEEHYWRLSKEVFELLCEFDRASSKALAALIDNVRPKDNILNISMRKLALAAGCDERTAAKALALMEDKDIIVTIHKPEKRKNGEWMLNPRLFAKKYQITQKLLIGKYDKQRGRPISPFSAVNTDTGEGFPLPEGVTPETANYPGNEHFYKAHKLFTKSASSCRYERSRTKAFSFILQNLDWARNDIHFTMAHYAKCYKTSTPAVSRMMQELRGRDIIISLGLGWWMVNPEVIMQGYPKRFFALKARYEKVKKENEKEAERRKEEKEKKAEEQATEEERIKYPVPPIPRELLYPEQVPEPAANPTVPAANLEQTKYIIPKCYQPIESIVINETTLSQSPTKLSDSATTSATAQSPGTKFPVPRGGMWQLKSEEKPPQNKFVPFIPAFMQKQMAEEERKRKEEMSQESVEDIDISAVPYDDGDSDDDYVPLEYVEASVELPYDDDDDATYIKDDDDLPF